MLDTPPPDANASETLPLRPTPQPTTSPVGARSTLPNEHTMTDACASAGASTLPLHWPISVSYSALAGFEACPRRWWLTGPGAWQAWPGGARSVVVLAQSCYEGKHAQALPAACGSAVHEAAEWAVRQTVAGRPSVTYDALWGRVRDRLNDLATRSLEAYRLRPRLGVLLPIYLGHPLRGDEVALTRTTAQSACRRLVASEVLDEVRLCGRRDVVAVERLLQVPLQVDGEPAILYGKLDLAYVLRETVRFDDVGLIAPGETGVSVYVDWKTGRGAAGDRRVRRQLAVGAYVATVAGVLQAHRTVGVVARVGDLSPSGTGDTVAFLGGRDIVEAEAWVIAGVRRLLQLERDTHGVPVMRGCPPRASRACATCPMQRACALSQELEDCRS